MMADTSQVNNNCLQLEPQSVQERAHLVVPSKKHGKTSKSSLLPISEEIACHEEESKDSLQAAENKPMIHLLGGSYALNLNLGKLNRKIIAKKEENERRKLSSGTNTPTNFRLNPTVGNWKDRTNIVVNNNNHETTGIPSEGITIMVAIGTIFSIMTYIGDLVSDLSTAYVLYMDGHLLWSMVSLAVTVCPIVAVNIVSLMWYFEDKLYHGQGWLFRLLSHASLCGVICRYVDTLLCGIRANREKKSSIFGSHYSVLYLEQRRIAVTLNLIECFLQDAPQFGLQVYIWTVQNRESTRALWNDFHVIQFISIACSLTTLCYSIVSFHQVQGFTKRHNVIPMSLLGCIAHFIWRVGTTGSRILAIMFALSSFPIITVLVVLLHWIFMVLWLKQQQSSKSLFLVPLTNKVQEGICEILIAGVHVFCYLCLFENQIGYRLVFYYGLQLLEDSFFIVLWCSEIFFGVSNNYQSWIYRAGSTIYYNAFFMGLFAMMVFYVKLHPNMVRDSPREPMAMPLSTLLVSEDFLDKFKSNFKLSVLRKSKNKGKYSLENDLLEPSVHDFQFRDINNHNNASVLLIEEQNVTP